MDRLSPEHEKQLGFKDIPSGHRELVSRRVFEEMKKLRLGKHAGASVDTRLKVAAIMFMNNFHLRLPGTKRRDAVEKQLARDGVSDADRLMLENERDVVFAAVDRAIAETGFDVKTWRKGGFQKASATAKDARMAAVLFRLWPVFKSALKYVDNHDDLVR